jgi:Cof subfamily protein (haloacid dehalogenase superfamily)
LNTLYISDLDGTLLTNEATLSDFSRTTLQNLLQDGLPFSVASARSVISMQMMLTGLDLKLPVVEFNGAFLSNLKTGRHEVINAVEPQVVDDLYGLIKKAGHTPLVSTFNGTEDRVYYREVANEGMLWYVNDRTERKDRRLRCLEDLTRSFQEQVVCLTVIGVPETLSELETAIHERHEDKVETHLFENQYSPGWYWLTVHDRRATKDQAIRTLMQIYGLREKNLVVFGDHVNDIKLFKIASESIAVANAAAELKPYATRIIGSNQEDSVVKYISEHWNRRNASVSNQRS